MKNIEESHFQSNMVGLAVIVIIAATILTILKMGSPNSVSNKDKIARAIQVLIPGALTSFGSNNVIRVFNPQTKEIKDYTFSLDGVIKGGIVVTNY